MEPQNILMGDITGVELPEKPVDETAVKELQNKAKYARSKEYKDLKQKADERVAFYQNYLPNGMPIGATTKAERDGKWELANVVIAEFKALFSEHEGANTLLDELYGDKG